MPNRKRALEERKATNTSQLSMPPATASNTTCLPRKSNNSTHTRKPANLVTQKQCQRAFRTPLSPWPICETRTVPCTEVLFQATRAILVPASPPMLRFQQPVHYCLLRFHYQHFNCHQHNRKAHSLFPQSCNRPIGLRED